MIARYLFHTVAATATLVAAATVLLSVLSTFPAFLAIADAIRKALL